MDTCVDNFGSIIAAIKESPKSVSILWQTRDMWGSLLVGAVMYMIKGDMALHYLTPGPSGPPGRPAPA